MLRVYLLLCCSFFSIPVCADSDVWLLVDTSARKIEVKKGKQTLETLNEIAIGRGGADLKRYRGDNITPFGNYRIGWVGERSSFRKFFGLTYPSVKTQKKPYERVLLIGSLTIVLSPLTYFIKYRHKIRR